jgi:hypothetical protein
MDMRNWKPIFVENSKIPIWLSKIAPIEIGAITLGFIVFSIFIGFPILYYYDYIKNYITFRDGQLAYYNIRAEKEAYQNDEKEDYLQTRPRWRWIWYK